MFQIMVDAIFYMAVQTIFVTIYICWYRNNLVYDIITRRIEWVFSQPNVEELLHTLDTPSYNDMVMNHLTKFTYEDFYGEDK